MNEGMTFRKNVGSGENIGVIPSLVHLSTQGKFGSEFS